MCVCVCVCGLNLLKPYGLFSGIALLNFSNLAKVHIIQNIELPSLHGFTCVRIM